MSQEIRSKLIAFRVKPSEYRYLEREAEERNLRFSKYLRAVLLPQGIYIPTIEKKKA